MTAYPSFDQVLGSSVTYADDRTVDTDVSGAVHIRAFYPARKSQFAVKHFLSRDDYATLMTFYDDHRLDTFDFTFDLDSVTYTCLFLAAPKVSTSDDPQVLQVDVALREAA